MIVYIDPGMVLIYIGVVLLIACAALAWFLDL
jgi:hypothetical protein